MRRAHRFSRYRSILFISVLLVILFSLSSIATAQTAEFSQGNKTANVVSLEVLLGSYPGRGINLPISLHYSSSGLWRIGFLNTAYANVNGYSYRRSVTEAIYAAHSTAGWTTSLKVPEIEWPKLTDRYKWSGESTVEYLAGYTYRIARIWIHMPDGSTHELRKSDQVYADNGVIDMSGNFYAVDGSRMRYNSTGATTGTLYLSDGTRYILNGSTAQYFDRNGNTLSYDGSQWTDTMGRHFNMPWPANPSATDYSYSLPGINGSITYVLKFRNLSTVFLPDVAGQVQKPVADYVNGAPPQPVGGSGLFNSGYTGDLEETDPGYERTFTYVVDGGAFGAGTFDPVVLAEIDLPNGQNYHLYYNAYGELDKVIYPTGGYQRYQYGGVATIGISSFPYGQGSRGMLSRWISPSGSGADEAQWSYSSGNNPLTVTAPNGTRSDTYLFQPQTYGTNQFGYEDGRMGLPVETRIYAPQPQGGAMLRRTLIDYEQGSQTYNRPSPGSGYYTAYRNPRPIKTVNLVLDTGSNALGSTTTTAYDATNQFSTGVDPTSSSEYDYASVDQTTAQTGVISSIPTGSLIRTTQTSYLNGSYLSLNILGLPASATVYNGSGTMVAQTTIGYDESSLYSYGAITGWTDPGTTIRGNATTSSRWLDYPTSTTLQAHTQYDQAGSPINSWDPKGNLSQLGYSSSYAYAFPTQTTTAVPDPTGIYGSTTSLTASSIYDFNTGLVTSTTDANNKTTTFEYNDPLNRIKKVNRPDGGWTSTEYGDTVGNLYVHTQTLQQTSPTQVTLETYQYFDPMGRRVRSFAKEGATYLTSDTQYDNMGRAWRVSSPYRTSTLNDPINPSGWIQSTFDWLGRSTQTTTTADNAAVSTVYSASTSGSYLGTTVTVTDPAGKQRRSVSDALGRLTAVYEDPNGANYLTSYTYDALGNLRKVDQGGQLRFFMYDSLGRLVRAKNPEQDANGVLNLTDSVSGNSAWSIAYNYDNNGNLTQKTDARGVVSYYGYDALNRNTAISYSDGVTMSIGRTYDQTANGKGRLSWEWQCLDATHCGSAESFNYDALGRVVNRNQAFYTNGTLGANFGVYASYDLAGNIKTETYPSGHTVTYNYDLAGRLADKVPGSQTPSELAFSGNLGDGVTRTYAKGITYDEGSRMARELFGTDTLLYHNSHYNVRGQLYDTRVGSGTDGNGSEFTWNRGCLQMYYESSYTWGASGPSNNGNLLRSLQYLPNNDQITSFSMNNEDYTYDSLNRLTSASAGSTYRQSYTYDRWGNRTIDSANTWGGVNAQQFSVTASNNRLGVPGGQSGTMTYDSAGNLINDTYSGQRQRTYDGENHMTAAQAYSGWSYYTYDAGGNRVRRKINNQETWQIYGIGGELVAEYAANASPSAPQKEYGYRNGQLLVTATSTTNDIQWLVTDQLGTPRMIFDKTGSLAGTKRHDYLPFGEELYAGIGSRSAALGYGVTNDGVRQKFTGYEADAETGLNFAQARYQSPTQGRFTSVDPLMASASVANPQSFNRYSYVLNKPLELTDPHGQTYLVDGSASMSDGIAMNLLRSGAGVLGPLQTTRWNPNSGGPDVGGFDTFRAVGNYAGWFNMHGVSISIRASLSLDGYGSWDAGGAYYGARGFAFGATGGGDGGAGGGAGNSDFNFGRDVICGYPCSYMSRQPRGHSSVNLSIYTLTLGTMHDDESDSDYAIIGGNAGVPSIGNLGYTQTGGEVKPGLYVSGQIALGASYTVGGNVLHFRSTFFHDWNLSSPTINASIYLVIPQNRNLGVSYPGTWEGVMNRRYNPGPGGRAAPQ